MQQVDVCIRTATLSQLERVQKKIDALNAKILKTEEALAATQSAIEIEFQRKQLLQLNTLLSSLREQETFCCDAKCLVSIACHATCRHHLAELAEAACTLVACHGLSRIGECCQPVSVVYCEASPGCSLLVLSKHVCLLTVSPCLL